MGVSAPARAAPNQIKVVRLATTANGTLATDYDADDVLDGVALDAGDRILIKNNATGANRGIYVVQTSGAPIRASDFDSSDEIVGALVYVQNGTENGDTLYAQTVNAPITVGVTNIQFSQVWKISRWSFDDVATYIYSPDNQSSVEVISGNGGDLVTEGIVFRLGSSFNALVFSEKDGSTVQIHAQTDDADNIELADTTGGTWRHVNTGGTITKALASMEERKGQNATATVASGTTSIDVTHGAGYTPAAQDILIVPTNSPTNDPGHWWVSNIGGTTFRINVRADPGSGGATFAWRVDR